MSTSVAGQSPEAIVNLVTQLIRDNIEAALVTLRTDRNDPRIKTEKPVEYFVSDMADPLRTPAVLVIADSTDYQVDRKGTNYHSAKTLLNVALVVEDINTEILTLKAYRYNDALRAVLAEANLTSANSKVKMTVVVERSKFTRTYTKAQKDGETAGVFRKETVLECSVYHFESY